jgi:hypothetical protein
MASQIFTGARGKLFIGADEIGDVNGITIRVDIEHARHKPIGQLPSKELVPVDLTVSGTVDTIRLVNNPLTKRRLFPNWKQLQGGGDDVTMQIVDDVTDEVLHVVSGVKFTSKEFRMDGKTIVSENVSFEAITEDDEFTSLTQIA